MAVVLSDDSTIGFVLWIFSLFLVNRAGLPCCEDVCMCSVNCDNWRSEKSLIESEIERLANMN